MKTSEVKKQPLLDRFMYWISERRQILMNRRAGKLKPYTDDEILQSHYFTNVEREDDKVTTWLRENVRDPLAEDPSVIFAVIAFRWFNWIPTGEFLHSHGYLTKWNTVKVIDGLLGFQHHGLQVFTGAFNISNSGSTKPKINRVCEDYIQPVWHMIRAINDGLIGSNMARAFKILKEQLGLGGSGFMAGQIICDLAYTYVLRDAEDWWTWCTWGPGSKRGMNRVYGLSEDFPMPRAEWDIRLGALRRQIREELHLELHARDVQNCLCEFSKYERALWDQGHLKRRYPGR